MGGEGSSGFKEKLEFSGNSGNSQKFLKASENAEILWKTRKAETAAGPPNGPPTRPRSGPPVMIRP